MEDGQDWVKMIFLVCRHRLLNLRNCTMRCILSIEAASPFGYTVGVEGGVSAVAKMIFPDSRALINLNAIIAVELDVGPL